MEPKPCGPLTASIANGKPPCEWQPTLPEPPGRQSCRWLWGQLCSFMLCQRSEGKSQAILCGCVYSSVLQHHTVQYHTHWWAVACQHLALTPGIEWCLDDVRWLVSSVILILFSHLSLSFQHFDRAWSIWHFKNLVLVFQWQNWHIL